VLVVAGLSCTTAPHARGAGGQHLEVPRYRILRSAPVHPLVTSVIIRPSLPSAFRSADRHRARRRAVPEVADRSLENSVRGRRPCKPPSPRAATLPAIAVIAAAL